MYLTVFGAKLNALNTISAKKINIIKFKELLIKSFTKDNLVKKPSKSEKIGLIIKTAKSAKGTIFAIFLDKSS